MNVFKKNAGAIKHNAILVGAISTLFTASVWADDLKYSSKLLLTGGVSQVEGAAGVA